MKERRNELNKKWCGKYFDWISSNLMITSTFMFNNKLIGIASTSYWILYFRTRFKTFTTSIDTDLS